MKKIQPIDEIGIEKISKDQTINLCLKTINSLKKQVLIFNNSKRSSESTAEKIAEKIVNPENEEELKKISEQILSTLSTPTKQCLKLAKCIKKGVAFHHSGLLPKQREIIENEFKKGIIKIISSTPTLAAGLNLPAYKVIIKDYKRYSQRGFVDIPILEYHQMSGRAGRHKEDKIGKTILNINNENEKEKVIEKYIFGKPEEIISKLAVEPTLKIYILSLIAMNIINTKEEIKEFFSNTFYAKQYRDLEALTFNIFRIINILIDYNFINQEDDYFVATQIGKKISELYLNPDTANYFLNHLKNFSKKFNSKYNIKYDIYSLIHFISKSIEMKPLFRISKSEEEKYSQRLEEIQDFLEIKFDPYNDDFSEFLSSLKTTDILIDWINEIQENIISEKYSITPGELNYKIGIIDWLLYSLEELSILKKEIFLKNQIKKIRTRFKYGIKEELIPLITLKGIGKIRARKLFMNGIRTLDDLKKVNFEKLKTIIPENTARSIKEEVSSGFFQIEINENSFPTELKNRTLKDEVSDIEVINLVENYNSFEKEKKEMQTKLNKYFR